MPGVDFLSLEDSFKAIKAQARKQRKNDNPTPVVVDVRGYHSNVRRELERRVAKEKAIGKAFGLEEIGYAIIPVKWRIARPVFEKPAGMTHKDFVVQEYVNGTVEHKGRKIARGEMVVIRKWADEYIAVV